jgi:hypothetical protein
MGDWIFSHRLAFHVRCAKILRDVSGSVLEHRDSACGMDLAHNLRDGYGFLTYAIAT